MKVEYISISLQRKVPHSFLLNKYSISVSYCREKCHFLSYLISTVYQYLIAEKGATFFLTE